MRLFIVPIFLVFTLIMLGGCIPQRSAAVKDPEPAATKSQPQAKAAAPTNPNNILLNIQKGMTPEEVRNIVGNPQRQTVYETGKRWVPFYYGTDLRRMDWFYGDFGHITFTINNYNNHKQVYEVHMK